jgi:hypothetical protein
VKIAEAVTIPVSSGTAPRVARKAEPAKSAQPAAPFVSVVVPDVIPIKPAKAAAAETHAAPAAVAAAPDEEAPVALAAPAAVAVKIHPQNADPAPAVQPVADTLKTVLPIPVPATPQQVAPVPVSTSATQAPATIVPPAIQAQPLTSKPAPQQPATLSQMDEPVSPDPKAQPLRSVSIEFAPDGAQDVRVRLTDHAGDVHISLHTADPSLSGRLNDGVKDLVESLTTAGYDAQAWTPDQGRQNQRQAEEPRKMRNQGSGDPDAENFSSVMHPIEENS